MQIGARMRNIVMLVVIIITQTLFLNGCMLIRTSELALPNSAKESLAIKSTDKVKRSDLRIAVFDFADSTLENGYEWFKGMKFSNLSSVNADLLYNKLSGSDIPRRLTRVHKQYTADTWPGQVDADIIATGEIYEFAMGGAPYPSVFINPFCLPALIGIPTAYARGGGNAYVKIKFHNARTGELLVETETRAEWKKTIVWSSLWTFGSSHAEVGNELFALLEKQLDQKLPAILPILSQQLAQTNNSGQAPYIEIVSPEMSRSISLRSKNHLVTVKGIASSPDGITSVTINGTSANLDTKGNFTFDFQLTEGLNKFNVRAVSKANIAATTTFSINKSSESEWIATKTVSGRNVALVVGINGYKNIDRLTTAVKDAQDVASILHDKYDFQIHLVTDEKATRSGILGELNRLRATLTPDDNLLIYYAGHGIMDKQTDGSFWLPYDAVIDNDTNWIDTKSLTDQLKRMSVKHVLVVADSCYSGTFTRDVAPALKSVDTRDVFLSKMRSKAARVLISSGGNEPVSDTGGRGHSIFADSFISALTKPEKGVFTAEELLIRQIRESVAGRASQTPEYKIIRNSGHEGGDFVFEVRK